MATTAATNDQETRNSGRIEITQRFRDALDRHGHGFQYAVIQKISEIFRQQQRWLFEVAEFPTTTGSQDTRIDFIVRPRGTRFFLVAECKRANPALSNWCFARSPYVHRNHSYEKLFIEQVEQAFPVKVAGKPNSTIAKGVSWGSITAFRIALEVKQPQTKGDPGGTRNAIEDAAGQVMRGMNGLVNTLSGVTRPELRSERPMERTWLMPAIFTTARLWTTSADLGNADIATGKLPIADLEVTEVPWLFWQYPMSPALKHEFAPSTEGFEFAELLDSDYMRTIAVVNANGIERFF